MIVYILLLWILIKLGAPVWCYVIWGIGLSVKVTGPVFKAFFS